MSDGSDQPKSGAPKSVNPFANPLSSTPGQPANPFGAAQLVGKGSPQPGASVNPFAQPSAPAAPAASANPFAQPAASANPFAAPAATGASVNPFAQPAATPEHAQGVEEPAEQPSAAAAEPQRAEDSGPSQDQLQELNPFRMAAEVPSADELQALAGDFQLNLVSKNTVFTYAGIAAASALVIGLLIGGLFSGHSDHAKRVVAWKQIDRKLKKPLEQTQQLEASIKAIIEGTKGQKLLWDQVESIPTRFAELDFSLLAPGVSMSQVGMLKLSALLLKMQSVFTKATRYRATTLKDKGSISLILDKKDFTAMPVHAIHVDNYLNKCLKRGRSVCNSFDSLQQGAGRVVGLMSAKVKRGKLSVITRDDEKPFEVNISDLVLVPRPDIVGSGMNSLMIHNQSLNELKAELDSLAKTRNDFERILQEKRSLE